jgi:hypothetical protein
MMDMATIRISEADAIRDIKGLLARASLGEEIVIEKDASPVVVLRKAAPLARSIEACIAMLPPDATTSIDEDFAKDVAAAVAAHREPLNPPAWD